MCETSQVCVGVRLGQRRPRPGGRARRSTRRAGRGCRRRSTGSSCGVSPGDRPARQRLEVEVVDARAGRRGRSVSSHGLGVVRRTPRRPGRPSRVRGAGWAAGSAAPWRGARGRALAQLGAEPVGQPRVAQRVVAPRARRARASRKVRTVEAVPAIGSSRSRARGGAAEAHADHGASSRRPRAAPRGPAAGTAPAGSARRAAGRAGGARRGARTSSSAGRIQAGTSSVRSPSSTSSRSPRSSSTHGWPGRRRSRVSSSIASRPSTSRSAAREPRRPRGEEPAYLGLDRVGRVDGVQPVGDVGEVPAELVGQRLRVVEVAGRQVVVGDLGEPASCSGALDQAAPGELVDADGDVQRDGVLGAGGVRGAGRQVHRRGRARAARSSAPSGAVHLPLLGAGGLEARTRRGCRSARRSPATPAGSGRRWPGRGGRARARARRSARSAAASSGAAPGRRRSRRRRTARAPCGASTSPVSGRPASVAPRVYADSGSTVPSRTSRTRRRADRGRGQQVVGVVEREVAPPARPGRSGGGGPATPRPSRGRSGRHR